MPAPAAPSITSLVRRTVCQLAACLVLTGLLSTAGGCSFATLFGKMVFGDPMVVCDFTRATGVNLAEDNKTVLIVCSTPESVKADFPAVNIDILEGISRQLKRNSISVVSSNDIATWMDENGGRVDDLDELAGEFDADYIIHIDLDELSHREINSPTLYRGRTLGNIYAFHVRTVKGSREKFLDEIFSREYRSTYPEHYALSADQVSARTFGKKYLDRISLQIGQIFYDHKRSDEQE